MAVQVSWNAVKIEMEEVLETGNKVRLADGIVSLTGEHAMRTWDYPTKETSALLLRIPRGGGPEII